MKVFNGFLFASTLCASAVFAGPKATFKSTTFDCGKVIEGKINLIHAEFVLSNTGDKPLKIINVRPGCGCTNVKFDSTVAPGKSMTIKSDVNIKGYHSGPLSKSISFTSNSEVDPTVRLVIQAEIVAPVKVSERFIRLESIPTKSPHVVDVVSLKKDLIISGVTFKMHQQNSNDTWQSDLPLDIKYKLLPFDSTSADGTIFRYKLQMFSPELKGAYYGDFTIKTNNPDMKELVVQGLITGS